MASNSSPADWCPDEVTQLEVVRAVPSAVTSCRHPRLGADSTKELWHPKARVAVAAAAAACCADPDTLDEIVRRDRRDQVRSAVLANPRTPLVALWRLSLDTATPVATKAQARALRLAASDLDAAITAALSVADDPGLAGAAATTFSKHLESNAVDATAVRRLAALPGQMGDRAAKTAAEVVFSSPVDDATREVRDVLWGTHPDVVVREVVSTLTSKPTAAALVEDLLAELSTAPAGARLPLMDAIRLFEVRTCPAAGELVADAVRREGVAANQTYGIGKLVDIAGHPDAPDCLAAMLPATPVTVARHLAAAGATPGQWQLAMQLLPDQPSVSLTAEGLVAQVLATS